MSVTERCVDNDNCAESLTHKMVEYNARKVDINDDYIVLINMRGQGLFFGYKHGDDWYTEEKFKIENTEDIISFFDTPLPGFFARRVK